MNKHKTISSSGFWKLCAISFVIVFGSLVESTPAQAGPITFNSALPLAEGMGILRSQVKLVQKSADVTPAARVLNVTAIPLVLAYGVSPTLALFAMLPYVNKRLDMTVAGKRIRRQTQGIADAVLFARQTVYQRDRPGDTLRIAPFAGLKLPTGSYHQRDGFGLLPRMLQPGSGSWDPLLGLTLTRQTLAWEFDLAAKYQLNTRASGFSFGDEAQLDASFQYRLFPRSLENTGVPAFVYAVLESNVIWNGQNKAGVVSDANSGGLTWNLAPGLQYVTDRFVLEAAIQIPVLQNLNGTALKSDWTVTAGFRWNFFL